MTITAAYYICLQYASEIFPTIVRLKTFFHTNISAILNLNKKNSWIVLCKYRVLNDI
jgi:hypothetical protein